jgi:hypothetical protein
MRTLFAPRDASHDSRVSSVHVRGQKYPSTTHLDLACNHRSRVRRISLLFRSLNGGVHRHQRARQDSCSSVGRDIFTATSFLIAILSAWIGYLVFEFLRKKL